MQEMKKITKEEKERILKDKALEAEAQEKIKIAKQRLEDEAKHKAFIQINEILLPLSSEARNNLISAIVIFNQISINRTFID